MRISQTFELRMNISREYKLWSDRIIGCAWREMDASSPNNGMGGGLSEILSASLQPNGT